MKIAIIGAGNMGGAIARGLAQSGSVNEDDLRVSNPSPRKLQALQQEFPFITVSQDNKEVVRGADLVLLAVKPWKLESVAQELIPVLDPDKQMLASVAGGVGLAELKALFGDSHAHMPYFYVMPNTAVAVCQSMTFLAACGATEAQTESVAQLFRLLGKVEVVEERLMDAGMSLASCGIAFAMRYIRAAMEGGVELGFYPSQAQHIVMQTLQGAVSLLENSGQHPEAEIDRVTTPGGITIRGLNEMEHAGFTDSVIRGLRAAKPLKK